ncbi:hypothetical protein [Polluticoccus soli]|uniref:hypothetical protein n=1 Tax=Polluticoccus soli TaxID=3034150 RepID=UPI0023E0BB95|nr:hypothetical protein [Flavipsychrobacter sp. JY13-12]
MNFELVFVLWIVFVLATGVSGIVWLVKGLRHNSNKHFWLGLFSLIITFTLVWFAVYVVSHIGKIGG